jgi:ketosteroid isomerase-like protein
LNEREVFLRAIDALNRGDTSGWLRSVHPEVVLRPLRAPMTGDYHGYRGVEKLFADTAETFEIFEVTYGQLQMLDDGRLYAEGKVRFRGRGGQVDTVVDTAGYAAFRDGLLFEWHDYGDRAAAKAALGIT